MAKISLNHVLVSSVSRLVSRSCRNHFFAGIRPLVFKFGVAALKPLQGIRSHDVGAFALPPILCLESLLFDRLRDKQLPSTPQVRPVFSKTISPHSCSLHTLLLSLSKKSSMAESIWLWTKCLPPMTTSSLPG